MRGRRPVPLTICAEDKPLLEEIARCRRLPWFQVRRARILLAAAEGQRVETLARGVRCDPATIWRVCRRYEAAGLEGVLTEAPRSGRPPAISPPPAGADRRLGLFGTRGRRAAHHPLVQ